jgi:hypothetical protein
VMLEQSLLPRRATSVIAQTCVQIVPEFTDER